MILRELEREADAITWEGANNDTPFRKREGHLARRWGGRPDQAGSGAALRALSPRGHPAGRSRFAEAIRVRESIEASSGGTVTE
jgi:hypothetical protein